MPLFEPPASFAAFRRAEWTMTLQTSPDGQLGEEGATHRRVSDGALFRPGPDGRAETLFGGSWVPAGWANSDLEKSLFAPRAHLGSVEKKGTRTMPMDFLRRIEKADFPLTVEVFADVNCVAVLRAAGLVEAEMIEAVEGDLDTCCAIVLRITAEGHAALTKGSRPDL